MAGGIRTPDIRPDYLRYEFNRTKYFDSLGVIIVTESVACGGLGIQGRAKKLSPPKSGRS